MVAMKTPITPIWAVSDRGAAIDLVLKDSIDKWAFNAGETPAPALSVVDSRARYGTSCPICSLFTVSSKHARDVTVCETCPLFTNNLCCNRASAVPGGSDRPFWQFARASSDYGRLNVPPPGGKKFAKIILDFLRGLKPSDLAPVPGALFTDGVRVF